jgi:hypothetical protein
MTMHPAVLYPMVASFSQPHADLLLSIEAERCGSGAANSGSEARADAVCRRLQPVVRRETGHRLLLGPHIPATFGEAARLCDSDPSFSDNARK